MIPVSSQALQQFRRLLDAAAQGGELKCIEQEGGSTIFIYVKKPLHSSEDFINKVLKGKPGPGQPAPVLKLVVDANADRPGAGKHVQSKLPDVLSSPPAEALRQRSRA